MTGTWTNTAGLSELWKRREFVLGYMMVNGERQVRSICARCGHNFKRQSGNGNEHKHLARHHKEVKLCLDAGDNPNSVNDHPHSQSTLDKDVVISPKFPEAAVRWIVSNYHAFHEVETESFRSMMEAASPRCENLAE